MRLDSINRKLQQDGDLLTMSQTSLGCKVLEFFCRDDEEELKKYGQYTPTEFMEHLVRVFGSSCRKIEVTIDEWLLDRL